MDIGNDNFEAETQEKIIHHSWPEFEELEGHLLVIHKAFYGLCTSGLCWHECFTDCLCEMGFTHPRLDLISGSAALATNMSTWCVC